MAISLIDVEPEASVATVPLAGLGIRTVAAAHCPLEVNPKLRPYTFNQPLGVATAVAFADLSPLAQVMSGELIERQPLQLPWFLALQARNRYAMLLLAGVRHVGAGGRLNFTDASQLPSTRGAGTDAPVTASCSCTLAPSSPAPIASTVVFGPCASECQKMTGDDDSDDESGHVPVAAGPAGSAASRSLTMGASAG